VRVGFRDFTHWPPGHRGHCIKPMCLGLQPHVPPMCLGLQPRGACHGLQPYLPRSATRFEVPHPTRQVTMSSMPL
jgi:hypothetical protein